MDAALPRLVVPFDAFSPSAFDLAEAADGLCGLIFLVDLGDPTIAALSRLLRKMGSVVDVAGLSTAQLIESVAHQHPNAILDLNAEITELLAEVAESLDLAFHSTEVAKRLVDKKLQRQVMAAAGLRVPDF